ncbi:MAG TPA: outer membrane beta-barrel protein [Burkholderiaceae bacterium]|jgi:opacity protein-like surface antigen|nr:outer membrane beta-barrel protein [Burkholderiaceae bacterium]
MRIFLGVPKGEIALSLASALLLAAGPARGQAGSFFNGSYVALSGGVVGLEDSQLDYGGALSNGNVRFDAGWAVSGAAGWRVLRFYRVEVEISHRENDVTDIDPGFAPDGSMKSTTYMVNGYFDIPIRPYEGVVPYIGAGVGRAQFTQDLQVDGGTLSHTNAHAFAYQAIGGLELPIIPRRMSVTFEYRYLATTRPLFQDQGGFFYHADYDSHTFLAGLRWGF